MVVIVYRSETNTHIEVTRVFGPFDSLMSANIWLRDISIVFKVEMGKFDTLRVLPPFEPMDWPLLRDDITGETT